MQHSKTADTGKPSIGIIGAGLAGLRCADILLQHGLKVTILEARERIGGRVCQSDHLGHSVDLGPNWIHGTGGNNVIFEIAKKTHTVLHAWDEEQAVLDNAGELLDPDEAEEYGELLWDDGVIAKAFKFSKEHHESIDPNRSLYDFVVEMAEDMFLDEDDQVAREKRKKFLLYSSMWGAYIGSSIERQSLKYFWLEECIEGENPFVAETYHKILSYLAKPALDYADIKYNCNVRKILSGQPSSSERSSVCLKSSDGMEASFDDVVVTTPLGWLKQNQDAFEPALPSRLSEAIANIGYGTLDKVYITFPSAFWDIPLSEDTKMPNGLDPEGKTPNVRATSAPLHQPSPSLTTKRHYPSTSLWLSPTYAADTNPDRWSQECLNLSALPPSCAHPTLLFYIYGDCSKHIANLVSSTQKGIECDSKLLDFFKPCYSLLPGYDESNPACKPLAILATAWANDEFAGYGSYCNFQVGLLKADKDIETMRYGMPERGVWFTGEHTAPFIALGTTTGAYLSGEKVAERILAAHGIETKMNEEK